MAEKKIQENPLPDEQPETAAKDMAKSTPDKAVPVAPVIPAPAPRMSVPSFTKTTPNDLYRRLLPAVLFVLTFVTVMTMLLIYMDTVALGAQQFRVNMSRDYELARIPQGSAALVSFVRQLHLAPRPPHAAPPPAQPGPSVRVLDRLYGPIENGTFVDVQPGGPRDPSCAWLQANRGWSGVTVRAAPRDFLLLRGAARALHACLSTTSHPREVSYPSDDGSLFSSRVLCLPLLTVLLAADAGRAGLVLLRGGAALPALTQLPFGDSRLRLQMIEVRSSDLAYRNRTASFLLSKNYTLADANDESIMFALQD